MVADYYAILGIDPRADRSSVEAALARCQPVWSAGTRNPKTKHTYQSYLDQIPAIRRALLGDPATRAAYDAERAAALRAEKDRKLDQLQARARLRAAKGGLTVSDRALLRAEAEKLGLEAADLDRLIAPIPPWPETPAEPADAPEPSPDVLDPTTRRQIRAALEHLGLGDLYRALDLDRDAPPAEIVARADAERQKWMRKAQVTAEKTAWLEVISYAQSHLTSPAARARYDRTLALEAEEALTAAIGFALQGLTRLDPGTRQALIDEAAGQGIGPERAGTLILRACRALGVAPDGGGPAPAAVAPRLLRCRACGGVTEFGRAARDGDAAACRHCRAGLRWACPVCKRGHWIDESPCDCGFPIARREPLLRHFEAAQQAHRARDFAAALGHLERVLAFAPGHIGARRGIEKIKERQAAIERARSAFEVERARRRLVAARAAVEAWARLVDPTEPDLRAAWQEVAQGLREAHALGARAEAALATDPPGARALFRQALTLAADLAEARDGLRRCPPDPPAALRVEVASGRVQLRWTPPPPDGLGPFSFRVVRKRRGVPAHPDDGEAAADVAAPECDDPGASPGESFGYAVFTRRNGLSSATAAVAAPTFVLGEVSDVRVETLPGQVRVSWTAPPGAVGVRVVRKRGTPPIGPGDGELIDAFEDQVLDQGLAEDRTYHYGLYALYKTPEGRALTSRGVVVAAVPQAPVLDVPALIIQPEPDGRVRLEWAPPARGQVRVLRSAEPPAVAPGTRLGPHQAEGFAGAWLDATGPQAATDPAPPPALCYYTPFLAWPGGVTVGHPVPFAQLSDPSDLRAVRVDAHGRVHLRWRWGAQAVQTLVVARLGRDPAGPDDPEARSFTVQDTDYGPLGYAVVHLPPSDRESWHIGLYSVAFADGRRLLSAGREATSRVVVPPANPEVTISYSLRKPRLFGRSWSLVFRTDPPGAAIPPTALIAHPRTVPLSADDGQVVGLFPAARDGAIFRIRPKVNLRKHWARVFADPQVDPDGLVPIRLRHPDGPARA